MYLYRIFLFFCFLFLKREKWSSLPWLKVTIDTRTLLKKSTGKISTQKWWTWFSPNLMSICRQQEENEEKTRKTARDKFCDNFYYILLSVFCFFLNASHFFFFFFQISKWDSIGSAPLPSTNFLPHVRRLAHRFFFFFFYLWGKKKEKKKKTKQPGRGSYVVPSHPTTHTAAPVCCWLYVP